MKVKNISRNVICRTIKESLTDDLLKPGFSGHCYVASEAYYHLMGGKASGLIPYSMKINGIVHWFLKDSIGLVIDLTANQFQFNINYSHKSARGRGFLTKQPSKRAKILINRVRNKMNWHKSFEQTSFDTPGPLDI